MAYYGKNYAGDPRWIVAKFGNCAECGAPIKGKEVFYYPKHKQCFCKDCGAAQKNSADFESCAFDEMVYNSQYGGY